MGILSGIILRKPDDAVYNIKWKQIEYGVTIRIVINFDVEIGICCDQPEGTICVGGLYMGGL